jgi:hypothetical protein
MVEGYVEHSLNRKIDDGLSTSKQMHYVAATAQTVGVTNYNSVL